MRSRVSIRGCVRPSHTCDLEKGPFLEKIDIGDGEKHESMTMRAILLRSFKGPSSKASLPVRSRTQLYSELFDLLQLKLFSALNSFGHTALLR